MAAKAFASVQVLRGVAALLVVLLHVGQAAEIPIGYWPLPQFTRGGSIGVDIFFCLSGFIMYLTAGDSFGLPHATSRFLLRRFLRIYPLYWLASAVALICGLAGIHVFDSHLESTAHTVKSFLLIPQARITILGPGWTLVHEVRFYVTLGLTLMLPRRWAFRCLVAWGFGSLGVLLMSYSSFPWMDSTIAGRAINFIFHPSSLQFLLGMLAAWIVCVRQTRPAVDHSILALGMASTGVVLQWFVDLEIDTKYSNVTLFTLPSFVLVLGAALLERRYQPRFPSVCVMLGDVSYSTYLSHVFVITAMVTLAFGEQAGIHSPTYNLWMSLLIVIGVHPVSVMIYRWIELPLHEWARLWTKRLSQ